MKYEFLVRPPHSLSYFCDDNETLRIVVTKNSVRQRNVRIPGVFFLTLSAEREVEGMTSVYIAHTYTL